MRELRYEPTAKRIRAVLNGTTVVDSDRAVLVWEPRRVVPTYAVPAEDIDAELSPEPTDSVPAEGAGDVGFALPDVTTLPVLDPRVPFSVHSTEGEPVALHRRRRVCPGVPARRRGPDRVRGSRFRRLRPLARGGRRDRRSSARPVPAHRRSPHVPPYPGDAGRHPPRRHSARENAVRNTASGPLLPAARRRRRGTSTECDDVVLRLQGRGRLPVRGHRRRSASRHRVAIRRAPRRRVGSSGARGLLRRAARSGRRRCGPASAGDSLVL
ncbi:LOW QUALITY PROTEIN: hypothetical protein OPAG_04479, partial [Rhodococcus opacus PD630]